MNDILFQNIKDRLPFKESPFQLKWGLWVVVMIVVFAAIDYLDGNRNVPPFYLELSGMYAKAYYAILLWTVGLFVWRIHTSAPLRGIRSAFGPAKQAVIDFWLITTFSLVTQATIVRLLTEKCSLLEYSLCEAVSTTLFFLNVFVAMDFMTYGRRLYDAMSDFHAYETTH